MFVKDFTEIDIPAAAVLSLMKGQSLSVLKDCVHHASAVGAELLLSVGIDVPPLDPMADGDIAISDIVESITGFVIPIAVRDRNFPHLDFDLEFFAMGENVTRINLVAFYDVSPFLLSTPLEKRRMQSVAESAARAFLACLSTSLTTARERETQRTS